MDVLGPEGHRSYRETRIDYFWRKHFAIAVAASTMVVLATIDLIILRGQGSSLAPVVIKVAVAGCSAAELFVKSVKTPKRTSLPDQRWTYSDAMTLPGGGPAWAVASAMLMTGMTHPDMGQVEARLVDSAPSPYGRSVVLRAYANAGQANNFTSYDLTNLGVPRDELVLGGPWYAYAYDRTAGRTGQIEYAQIQVTMHTMPNRADTDSDGLNDSEEINFGSDGFATNPWVADSDADGIEASGCPHSGALIAGKPSGYRVVRARGATQQYL